MGGILLGLYVLCNVADHFGDLAGNLAMVASWAVVAVVFMVSPVVATVLVLIGALCYRTMNCSNCDTRP